MGTVQNKTLIAEEIVKAAADPAARKALLADPVTVLRSRGVDIPQGRRYLVHEDTSDTVHIVVRHEPLEDALKLRTLPANPTMSHVTQWIATMVQDRGSVAAELLADPVRVLTGLGVPVAPGSRIRILQDSAELQHLVIPPAQSLDGALVQELSDAQLDAASGGKLVFSTLIVIIAVAV